MSEDFYDHEWWRLLRRNPLVAKKLEALRMDCVDYEDFEELEKRVCTIELVLKEQIKQKRRTKK